MDKEEIIKNYDRYNEDNRLKDALGILEEEHTRRLILKYMQPEASVIFDIGAGTGPYSIWLADLGYKVHYSDIVPKHIDIFKNRQVHHPNIASISTEDARSLSYQDNSADLILLNGPLYHLPQKEDRLKVIKEAYRVLKKNGRLLAFTISRFAGLNYALSSGRVFEEDYYKMVYREMQTGTRDNQDLKINTFHMAYFHLLEEIESELAAGGFDIVCSAGVVGPAWNTPDLDQVVKDEIKKDRLLSIAGLMEPFPMQGPKMLTVGRKNN